MFQALLSWQSHCDAGTPGRLKGRTLKGELLPLAKLADRDDALLIAVFDQFEELFTAYAPRWEERRGFFKQLADALESISNLRVLLAMREDWLASLDPFASLVPENLRTRFRLERLRRDAALEAVKNPLQGTGRKFGPGVAEKLIDNLMTIRVRRPRDPSKAGADNGAAGIPTVDRGPSAAVDPLPDRLHESEGYVATSEYVEPVQMQVVCQTLWSNLEAGEAEITAEHLERCGDVNQALSRFYEDCVGQASQVPGLREGDIRRWFDERLITPAGTRGLVLREPDTTGDLDNDAVDVLESCHLIRGEDRGGARWYELSHDRFIEPVKNSNRHWQSTRPGQALWSDLNRRAATWDAAPAEKKPSLLLNKTDLARAEAWSKAESSELGLSDLLRRFVDDSRDAIDRAEMADQLAAERRAARNKARTILFLTCGAAGLASLLTLTLFGWLTANANNKKAERLALEAKRQETIAHDQTVLANENEVLAEKEKNKAMVSRWAMQATLEKATLLRAGRHPGGHQNLQKAKGCRSSRRARTSPSAMPSPISPTAASSGLTRSRSTRSRSHRGAGVTPSGRETKGPIVAVGGRDGLVELWDLGDYDNPDDDESKSVIKPPLAGPAKSGWVNRIVFAPAGRMLAFCTGDTASANPEDRGSAWVWTAPESPGGQGDLHPLETERDSGPVADIAFSPDGASVATASSRAKGGGSKPARRWRLERRRSRLRNSDRGSCCTSSRSRARPEASRLTVKVGDSSRRAGIRPATARTCRDRWSSTISTHDSQFR